MIPLRVINVIKGEMLKRIHWKGQRYVHCNNSIIIPIGPINRANLIYFLYRLESLRSSEEAWKNSATSANNTITI